MEFAPPTPVSPQARLRFQGGTASSQPSQTVSRSALPMESAPPTPVSPQARLRFQGGTASSRSREKALEQERSPQLTPEQRRARRVEEERDARLVLQLTERLERQTRMHGAISQLQQQRITELESQILVLELAAAKSGEPVEAPPTLRDDGVLPPVLRPASGYGELEYAHEQVERLAETAQDVASEMRAAQREAEISRRVTADLEETLARLEPRQSPAAQADESRAVRALEAEARGLREAALAMRDEITDLKRGLADARRNAARAADHATATARAAAAAEVKRRAEQIPVVLPPSDEAREVARLKLEVIALRTRLANTSPMVARRHDSEQRGFWSSLVGEDYSARNAEDEEGSDVDEAEAIANASALRRRAPMPEPVCASAAPEHSGGISVLSMGDERSQVLVMPDGRLLATAVDEVWDAPGDDEQVRF